MPEVYEPVPGEAVAYGLSLENSDFGNGALRSGLTCCGFGAPTSPSPRRKCGKYISVSAWTNR